ncbi:unnamed protein product [Parnassius apollo]|uniref:(apollo) hypothetical protein n=1 Tax=Parnassius apollo TaxID=110799 RepID=A0A8S3X6F4_PARAO|nr:unnamed protein product [Parnassius apollo]
MDKWLMKGQNKEDNPKLERKRKPEKETSEASTSSIEVEYAVPIPSSSLTSVGLATSESNNPQTKKIKRLNKFNDLWLQEPNFLSWLCKDSKMKDGNDLAHCMLCSVSIIAHKSDLIRHMNSDRHKKKSLEIQNIPKISNYLPVMDLEINVRKAELKLAEALAENNIPISFSDILGPLCKEIFADSVIAKNMNLHRTKATAIINNVLGNTFLEDIYEKLRGEKIFFSLIMDETTDQSSLKQCCFTAVVYDENTNKVEHLFLDMVELSSGTAKGLRSSQRQLKFREFQEFFQVEIHKILTPAQTRWLSLKACIDRVLEQYTPLKAYLTETVFSDPSKTTEEMLITMNNQFTVVYLEFMFYVLALVTKFNVLFQSETSLLYKLKPEVENLLKTLSSNFMKISYIKSCANILNADFKNPTHFLSLNEIYIGLKAGESIEILKNDENVPRAAIAGFYRTCQEFYIELTSDITKRFDFGDPLFSIISAVNPSEAQQFLIKSPVLKRFPVLYKFVTAQKLDDEWRTHALLDFEQHGLEIHGDNINAESYWGKVFRLKNAAGEYMFPNIKIVMSLLLILPFSNASVERKFSALRCLKTENRNRLNTEDRNVGGTPRFLARIGGDEADLRSRDTFSEQYNIVGATRRRRDCTDGRYRAASTTPFPRRGAIKRRGGPMRTLAIVHGHCL